MGNQGQLVSLSSFSELVLKGAGMWAEASPWPIGQIWELELSFFSGKALSAHYQFLQGVVIFPRLQLDHPSLTEVGSAQQPAPPPPGKTGIFPQFIRPQNGRKPLPATYLPGD
jgi:hypothetical protein